MKNKKSIKVLILLSILLSFLLCGCDETCSKLITAIEHPFETIFSPDGLQELQHGIPQKNNGRKDTTLCWSSSNRKIANSSKELFSSEPPYPKTKLPSRITSLFYFNNMDAAYNLTLARNAGKYGENLNLLFYDYEDYKSYLILFKLDGVSHISYTQNFIIYTPYKLLRRFSCSIDKSKCEGLGWWSFCDGVWGIFICSIECILALILQVVGAVIGTICHPIDTICNLIPGVFFALWELVCALIAAIVSILELIFSIIKIIFSDLSTKIVDFILDIMDYISKF